eukprot:s1209_g2.t1
MSLPGAALALAAILQGALSAESLAPSFSLAAVDFDGTRSFLVEASAWRSLVAAGLDLRPHLCGRFLLIPSLTFGAIMARLEVDRYGVLSMLANQRNVHVIVFDMEEKDKTLCKLPLPCTCVQANELFWQTFYAPNVADLWWLRPERAGGAPRDFGILFKKSPSIVPVGKVAAGLIMPAAAETCETEYDETHAGYKDESYAGNYDPEENL